VGLEEARMMVACRDPVGLPALAAAPVKTVKRAAEGANLLRQLAPTRQPTLPNPAKALRPTELLPRPVGRLAWVAAVATGSRGKAAAAAVMERASRIRQARAVEARVAVAAAPVERAVEAEAQASRCSSSIRP
jgi:hypothetical protein